MHVNKWFDYPLDVCCAHTPAKYVCVFHCMVCIVERQQKHIVVVVSRDARPFGHTACVATITNHDSVRFQAFHSNGRLFFYIGCWSVANLCTFVLVEQLTTSVGSQEFCAFFVVVIISLFVWSVDCHFVCVFCLICTAS